MDIGHVTIDQARGFPHTVRVVFSDRLDEFQAQWCEAVNEIVVRSELECCLPILFVKSVGFSSLNELECVVAELFSVANGDVERGHIRRVVVRWLCTISGPWGIAVDSIPVFVCARPEFDE